MDVTHDAYSARTIVFLFYFNRLFAFFVSQAIRTYSWHKYRVYIDFQALQFSPLGGRVFFKGLRYHGRNETILVTDGYITWRYWLRRVRTIELDHSKSAATGTASVTSSSYEIPRSRAVSGGEQAGKQLLHDLPCRITVEARGLEWFVYNRSPAYDAILARISASNCCPTALAGAINNTKKARDEYLTNNINLEKSQGDLEDEECSSLTDKENEEFEEKMDKPMDPEGTPQLSRANSQDIPVPRPLERQSLPFYLNIFPIGIDCTRGAVVMGNENTRSVLVAKFDHASGKLDARDAGPLDIYRQSFDFEFQHPVIQLKPNGEFKESQLALGSRVRHATKYSSYPKNQQLPYLHRRRMKRELLQFVVTILPYFRQSVESFLPETAKSTRHDVNSNPGADGMAQSRWLGLSRYLDDNLDSEIQQDGWGTNEYASSFTIADSPTISMSFYWDVPGPVPSLSPNETYKSQQFATDINGSEPPAWGLELKVGGGTINYGPWADRQRTDLQTVFFPPLYTDSQISNPLRPGQTRISTVFHLTVELENEVTLRIPTREESKDWRWKGHASTEAPLDSKTNKAKKSHRRKKGEKATVNPGTRPAGWLSLVAARDSCITYTMDMVSSHSKYRNHLHLDLKFPEMSSSVNHGTLWRSSSQTISCDLSNPLEWNTLRTWSFDIRSEDLELFILRDHIFLLTDLINDWTSGPPGVFNTFVPYNYCLNLLFPNFKLFLNVNDSNIINNPSDQNDNTFIIIWGNQLTASLTIPLVHFQPLKNKVTFDVDAYHGGFRLSTPIWNTQHALLDSPDVATLKDLRFDGCYDYCTSTATDLTDTVVLNLKGIAPTVHLYGFLIRYFIKIKDNYFGEDLHFQTLEEYQVRINSPKTWDTSTAQEHANSRLTNDLDVVLVVIADNACLMLPANLYSAKENIKIDISSIAVNLRFTNYYMDLEASFSPLSAAQAIPGDPQTFTSAEDSSTQIFIDGITILSHRLFGLPPAEPTYVCNWDFEVGRITGETSVMILSTFISALRCIAFSFGDTENALPPFNPLVIHDATFLRAKIHPIYIWLHVENYAMLLSTDVIKFDLNDWAGSLFSERLHVTIPQLELSCVDAQSASRHRTRLQPNVITYGYAQTSIDIRMVQNEKDLNRTRQLQQDHMRLHDSRTTRIPWLLHVVDRSSPLEPREQPSKIRPPAMPYPPMPEPIDTVRQMTQADQVISAPSNDQHASSPPASRQSSFLSFQSRRRRSGEATIHHFPSMVASRPKLFTPRTHISLSKKSLPRCSDQSSRKSLNQNNVDVTGRTRNGLPPSSVAFSSSYEVPYFPLHSVQPDTREVPLFGDGSMPDQDNRRRSQLNEQPLDVSQEDAASMNFIVSLTPGIRAFCTMDAIQGVKTVLEQLQAKDPTTILDEVQLTAIADVQRKQSTTHLKKLTQLRLDVPRAVIRFKNVSQPSGNGFGHHNVYDLRANQLTVTARSMIDNSNTPLSSMSTMHFSLKQLNVAATAKGQHNLNDEARVDVILSNLTSWLAQNQGLKGEIKLGVLEIVSLNLKLDSLIALSNSTTTLLDDLASQLSDTALKQSRRQQYLVHQLATSGEAFPNPALLTGASYVLRSAIDHPRNSDTWKMISRLRYILQCLPPESYRDLYSSLTLGPMGLPDNGVEEVIAYFNQWRSWDLEHVRASSLLVTTFGDSVSHAAEEQISLMLPMQMSLSIGIFRCSTDPGPMQNIIEIDQMALMVHNHGRHTADNGERLPNVTQEWYVELYLVRLGLQLNWDLCELVTELLQRKSTPVATYPHLHDHAAQDLPIISVNIHLVVIVKTSDLSFTSINLKVSSVTECLRASSLIVKRDIPGLTAINTISVQRTTSDLSYQSKALATMRFQDSSLHFSFEEQRPMGDRGLDKWKFATLCSQIDLDIQEDPLSLLGTLDVVLGDEIAYVYKFMQLLEKDAANSHDRKGTKVPSTARSIDAVFLLDKFRMGVTLVSALGYSLDGNGVRGSVRTTGGSSNKFVVDFDLREHFHAFKDKTKTNDQEVCRLAAPAINGHAEYSNEDVRIALNIFVAVEKTNLDASAVYAVLSTVSRSEIATFGHHLSRDVDLIKQHYGIISGPTKMRGKSRTASKTAFLYNARLSAAGLSIRTTTGKDSNHSAKLGFELGSSHLHVLNQEQGSKQPLSIPEILLSARDMRLLLERVQGHEVYLCGEINFGVTFCGTSHPNDHGDNVRSYQIKSHKLEISLHTETASIIVDILGHFQQRFRDVDLSEEVRSIRAKRRARAKSYVARPGITSDGNTSQIEQLSTDLFTSMYSLEMTNIQVVWKVGNLTPVSPSHEAEDLVLSVTKIDLATERGNAARLMIENFQLQMVPASQSRAIRSFNSALLPEMVFNVAYLSTPKDRRLAFQAAGKSLDLRLTSQFILPASDLQRSMGLAAIDLRKVVADWNASLPQTGGQARNILGKKKFSSLLVDADFAGAVVYIQGRKVPDHRSATFEVPRGGRNPQHGRYGQFTHEDASSSTTLRAPGLAWKIEYKDLGLDDPSLKVEIKVDASTNVLYPTIVPLVLEISSSIKEIVGEAEVEQQPKETKITQANFLVDEKLHAADPTAILGNCSLNLGLRICRQEFSLSCQPIARVAATAQFEDIYITVNTVQSVDQRFIAVGAAITRLQASVQHVYSRESTGSFDVESMNISLMNSKHVSNVKGLSAILKITPMNVLINAKQLHDFLLFREIWIPEEMRHSNTPSATMTTNEPQAFVVQRYQQVAASGAFLWNASVSIVKLDVQLDLGQAVGKSSFSISNFWVSSKKNSDWEQNLCLGFDKVGVESTGRMSGFVELQNLRLRTSITWSVTEEAKFQTPLIQASLKFDDLRLKAALDYQPFLVADLLLLDFLMYNVRDGKVSGEDRLVAVLNGEKVQVFCTTTSSAQAIALYQAIQRLLQEKQSAYESSLRDIEKYLRRNSSIVAFPGRLPTKDGAKLSETSTQTPIQLHTNVVVTLKAINVGAFPSTFFDHQIFKLEALDALARFTVTLEQGKVHSGLGLTLGQLRIALSGISHPSVPKTLGDVTVDEVVRSATGSRGGTILKVPRVVASMQTWQTPESNKIDYIFKSSFEGKVEVGWNYSRISFIRGMWATHSEALAQRLGKPLPPLALQITGGPRPYGIGEEDSSCTGEQDKNEKITAVVQLPQSKYQYTALEPPIIETPQLRDMGEATPPLEWIGLHRERLPNLTHQIVIVTLLELAKEVEDAYSKILGSS